MFAALAPGGQTRPMTDTDAPLPADLADLPDFLVQLCAIAAEKTQAPFRIGTPVDDKGAASGASFDPVTAADREAERALRDAIAHRFPRHGILGEEEGLTPGTAPYRWILDPVDGTRAFICGVPVWTTLIGLERDGVPVGGVISQPFLNEHWIAAPGARAVLHHRNGSKAPARPSACTRLAEARVAVTDLRTSEYFTDAETTAIGALLEGCRVTRFGLDAYGFALVASGHMDLAVEAGCHWWDVAGPAAVVRGAGGIACDWQGDPLREGFGRGRMIFAATADLAAEAVARLRDVPA